MLTEEDHKEVIHILKENAALIEENNKVLKKLQRNIMIGTVLTVIWYALLIGMPFALYFYVLEPYFEAFGSNYETFRSGVSELPGLKGLEHLLPPRKE